MTREEYKRNSVKDVPDIYVGDMISRQIHIEQLHEICDKQCPYNEPIKAIGACCGSCFIGDVIEMVYEMPSAEPDAIPLEWIAKHLEWLDNCDNDFAQLAKVNISTMVKIWKNEKTQ